MRPLYISVENFYGYIQKTEIDFRNLDLAVVVGKNGAGKSTFFIDTIYYALYGETRGDVDSVLPRKNKNSTSVVEFEFTLNNLVFRIVRTRTKNQNSLFLERAIESEKRILRRDSNDQWEQHSSAKATETQEIIHGLLGPNFKVALESAVMRTGATGLFASARPGERQKILFDILNLEKHAQISKIANDHANQYKTRIDACKNRIEVITNTLKQYDNEEISIDGAQQALKEQQNKNKEYNESKIEVTKMLSILENSFQSVKRKTELEKLLSQEDACKSILEPVKIKIQKFEEENSQIEKEIETIEESLPSLQKKLSMAKEKRGAAQANILRAKNEQESMQKIGDLCFTCYQSIDQTHRTNILEKLIKSQEEATEDLTTSNIIIKNIDNKLATSNASISSLRKKLKENISLIRSVETEAQKASALLVRIEAAKDELNTLNTAVRTLRVSDIEKQIGDLKKEEIEINNQLRIAQKDIDSLQVLMGKLAEREHIRTAYEKEMVKLNKEINELFNEEEIYRLASQAFGKNGIPALILPSAIEELNIHSNEVLSLLSDGRLSTEIVTQVERKDGKGISDKNEILVYDNGIKDKYVTFSNGEHFRIDIALLVGRLYLAAKRVGTPIEFFILDEGFGSLDPEGIQALTECLSILKDYFKLILVITHVDTIAAAFPTVIEVNNKDRNGSKIHIKTVE